jgi:hypothetical protein
MSHNPYAPPGAKVDLTQGEKSVPEPILKKIRNAWVAGLISAGVTLVVTVLAISGVSLMGYTAWELLDVVLILGLTLGIYKKSRVCAIAMLTYFVASKIMLISETGKPSGLVTALIFIYYYWQGVLGTFAYHRFRKG